jgi:hypothetical protein
MKNQGVVDQKDLNTMIAAIAKMAHNVNAAYCLAIGDDSQVLWEEAPKWQQQSAVNGVSFHLQNPDADPKASHESWMAEKKAEGWTYGAEKNAEKKTHPCYMQYELLPAGQRAKDFIFRSICHNMIGLFQLKKVV